MVESALTETVDVVEGWSSPSRRETRFGQADSMEAKPVPVSSTGMEIASTDSDTAVTGQPRGCHAATWWRRHIPELRELQRLNREAVEEVEQRKN